MKPMAKQTGLHPDDIICIEFERRTVIRKLDDFMRKSAYTILTQFQSRIDQNTFSCNLTINYIWIINSSNYFARDKFFDAIVIDCLEGLGISR